MTDFTSLDRASSGFDWSPFNTGNIDFLANLKSVYQPQNAIDTSQIGRGSHGILDMHTSYSDPMFGNYKTPDWSILYQSPVDDARKWFSGEGRDQRLMSGYNTHNNAISFKDQKIQDAINQLNTGAAGYLRPILDGGFLGGPLSTKASQYDNGNKYTTPIERLNNSDIRNKLFSDVSRKTGISLTDLQNHYGTYSKAYRGIYDPVGANWQDLQGSPFKDSINSAIRKYSGLDNNFFDKVNSKLGADDLSAEYYALHDPQANRLGGRGGVEQRMSDIKDSNPYARQDWTDYLPGSKPTWMASADEVNAAKKAMADHSKLLNADYANGGAFDLLSKTTKPGASHVKTWWQYSPTESKIDIAQNALGQNGGNFSEIGLNPADAYKESIGARAKSGGFLSKLSPITNILSFVPEPVGWISKGINAINTVNNMSKDAPDTSAWGSHFRNAYTNATSQIGKQPGGGNPSPNIINPGTGGSNETTSSLTRFNFGGNSFNNVGNNLYDNNGNLAWDDASQTGSNNVHNAWKSYIGSL